ncbi:unnamed protein product [Mytilus coruscus]|uniref:Integrase zinc-binding domain-containing protein n=1 Tax=Mytilus coruscus TaxID=42192 RepID=A0A6J8AJN5_MYTCO|nr:unnamed protein product [Mytilus coruscus]
MATNAPILSYYDPKQPLTLNVDTSSKGLGAVLLQNDKPIAYASRALTPTQQRYAQIEKETLAIVFGCQKFHHYVYGRQVEYKGLKLIIPTSLRKEILQLIHEPHMGIVKCETRAREFMYWPGMMPDIKDIVEKCETCAVNNKEPMITSKLPDRPSSKLAADLFQFKGEHYLLTVDYYSKLPEIETG